MSAKVATAKKATTKSAEHPSVAIMVNEALAKLDDKNGSSHVAIKKYILSNFNGIEMVRAAPLINRYLKKAVVAGTITQRKGSFSAGNEDAKKTKVEKPATKKAKAAKKTTTPKKADKKPVKKAAIKITKPTKTPTKKPAAKKLAKKPVLKKLAKK